MKRMILALLPLLLLTACTASGAADSSAPAAESAAPTAEAVVRAYAAAAEVYDWFDLASLPSAGEWVGADGRPYDETADGIPYQAVCDARGVPAGGDEAPVELTTYAGLERQVRLRFAPELADRLLDAPGYRDIGGRLHTTGGARGADPGLLGRHVSAARAEGDRWVVTVTFYADSYALDSSAAVVGYSEAELDCEWTEDGPRFLNFCSSDGLDETADTVFRFSYALDDFLIEERDMESWSPLKLLCWLLHADGAYSEGAFDILARRVLEEPDAYFSAAAALLQGPWENTEQIVTLPAPAWSDRDLRTRLRELLDGYRPKTPGEQTALDLLSASYRKNWEAPDSGA